MLRHTRAATMGLMLVVAGVHAQSPVGSEHAEPPQWPLGFRLSEEWLSERARSKPDRKTDVLVWLPEQAEVIRAVLLIVENTDSKHFGEHALLREYFQQLSAGVIYIRGSVTSGIEYHHQKPLETPPEDPTKIPRLLTWLGDQLNRPELRHVPWLTFGKSSRGEFPFRLAWLFPERTIAGITYHGETPTWPIPSWAAPQTHSVLYVCLNGQEEWSGTWYRHVRPSLLNYRRATAWLPHQAVVYRVGHGNYADVHGSPGWGKPVPPGHVSVLRVWDYLALFAKKAIELRLPPDADPRKEPVTLNPVDPSTGFLVHPRAVETFLGTRWLALRKSGDSYQPIPWPDEKHPVWDEQQGQLQKEEVIRKWSDVPDEQRSDYLWLPDEEMVRAWEELHTPPREAPVPKDAP